jgi:hypothetical protein
MKIAQLCPRYFPDHGALESPQSSIRASSGKLLLVCDYDGGLLHSLLETLTMNGLSNQQDVLGNSQMYILRSENCDWSVCLQDSVHCD